MKFRFLRLLTIGTSTASAWVQGFPYFPRLPCQGHEGRPEKAIFKVHNELEDVVQDFLRMYDSYADPVVEVMDAVVLHQISAISESFLRVLESLRLILCHSICQEACNFGGQMPPTTFWIDHFITNLHRDIELLSPTEKWRGQVQAFMYETWAQLRNWLEDVVQKDEVGQDDWDMVTGGARELFQGIRG